VPTYHSFPGAAPAHREYNEFGVDILKSMIDIGLVLVPEFIQFDEYYEDCTAATLKIGQKRLCFTDIEQSRLRDHSRTFGRLHE
jgi:hypothetical protein